MTIKDLIKNLQMLDPEMDVRLWDSKRHMFCERLELQPSLLGDELLIVPVRTEGESALGLQ